MQQQGPTAHSKPKEQVTTAVSVDCVMEALVYAYDWTNRVHGLDISPWFNVPAGIRLRYPLELLIAVKVLKRCTRADLISYLKGGKHSVNRCVAYLHDIGYIGKVAKRRYVIPFGAFKKDTAYVVTPLGESVLRKIIAAAL